MNWLTLDIIRASQYQVSTFLLSGERALSVTINNMGKPRNMKMLLRKSYYEQ